MNIDINDIRAFFTVLVFACFIGVWIWAWSDKRKQAFDEAARLPFVEDGESEIEQEGARR